MQFLKSGIKDANRRTVPTFLHIYCRGFVSATWGSHLAGLLSFILNEMSIPKKPGEWNKEPENTHASSVYTRNFPRLPSFGGFRVEEAIKSGQTHLSDIFLLNMLPTFSRCYQRLYNISSASSRLLSAILVRSSQHLYNIPSTSCWCSNILQRLSNIPSTSFQYFFSTVHYQLFSNEVKMSSILLHSTSTSQQISKQLPSLLYPWPQDLSPFYSFTTWNYCCYYI